MVRHYKRTFNRAIKYATAGSMHAAKGVRMTVPKFLRTGYTQKKSKNKKTSLHQGVIEQPGHGGTLSSFYYKPRPLPRVFRLLKTALSKNYYSTNNSGRFTATPGIQGVSTLLSMAHATDALLIASKISADRTTRFCLQNCSSEILFTNQDLGNVRVTLYDIVARRDLNSASVQYPDTAWTNSYLDEGAANVDYKYLGATPFSSDLFTQFFRVVKVTHVTLGQGTSHTHRINFKMNKILDSEYLNNTTYGYKGLSCFTMMVAHGMPYNDTTTKTQVTTGTVAIDWVTRTQYQYTWTNDSNTSYSKLNNLPSAFNVSESVLDTGSGAVAVDVQA